MNFDINDLTAPPAPIVWQAGNTIFRVQAKTWFEARQALSAMLAVEPTQLDVRPYGHQ